MDKIKGMLKGENGMIEIIEELEGNDKNKKKVID